MKYIKEFRSPEIAEKYLDRIKAVVTKPWNIMEVCGGQTHSLVKNGILDLLPNEINMVHGPGCPVCVTPLALIDYAVLLAEKENVVLCSFGDMLRVPGSSKSLLEAKAAGAEMKIVYSPLDVVSLAANNPQKEYVFFAIGFETTAPPNALSILQAQAKKLENYSVICSQVLVPPALEAVFNDADTKVDGVLAAGHVCTIMGTSEYEMLTEKYKRPIVVTGFEPVDLLLGILKLIQQLESGKNRVENAYKRVVKTEGAVKAKEVISRVFELTDRDWRGIGSIPLSGYKLKSEFEKFNALKKFNLEIEGVTESDTCIAGEILKGIKKPYECTNFKTSCTPQKPLGAPMVSSEGACAAYFYSPTN